MTVSMSNTSNEHPTMHPRESTTYVRGGWPHLPTRPCQRNSEHYLAGSFSTCDSAALFSAQISTNPLTS